MLLRSCSLLFVSLLLLCVRLSDAFSLRQRRSDPFDFDLYDEPLEDVSDRMYSLCARLHKRQDERDKRIPAPLIMRMCDLLS